MSVRDNPVFFDPKGRRARKFWFGARIAVAFCAVLLISLGVSLARPASLPAFKLVVERSLSAGLLPHGWINTEPALARKPLRHDGSQGSTVPRFAFYNSWDENSFFSLRANAGAFDVLLPEWLHAIGSEGTFGRDDARRESETRLWVQKNAPHLKIMPVINNYNTTDQRWDGSAVSDWIGLPHRRQKLITDINQSLRSRGDHGVVVDFKLLEDESIGSYVEFLGELRDALSREGRKVLAVLPAYEKRFDLWQLSEAVDHVVILGYDQHWEGEQPGPLSAQNWFEAQLDRVFATNTGTKFIVAIGSYAIDWRLGGVGRRIPVPAAWDILADAKASLVFDGDSLNGTFGYQAGKDANHQVWLLDGVTAYNQIAAALALKPGGIALSRLGTEDPTVWHSFAKGRAPDEVAIDAIKSIRSTNNIVHKGEGEVLTVSDRQADGRREIDFVPQYNLITSQRLAELPTSMSLHRWGHNQNKLLALTFDDGPTTQYTTQILKILRDKDVKATFFVVGANAALQPGILQSIYTDGHDIGNHTFTHPNLRNVGVTQLDLELNATQRVLEAKLGVGTRLFRPPFNKDAEPINKDEARTLINSAALGYITIGLKIDPLDWSRPGVSAIVERTVSYAEARRGNVVLLHDGGGDRQQTVDALPAIIDQLQAKGFKFVTVHELLGLPRHEVMPSVQNSHAYEGTINNAGFNLVSGATSLLGVLFMTAIGLGVGRLLLVSAGAIAQQRRVTARVALRWQPHSVAVLVPAFNEDRVIVDSIRSLLQLQGMPCDVIVVDDGSTDRTFEIASTTFAGNPRVKVVRKVNGGKASALNYALTLTDAEIVIAIDADTRLDDKAAFWLTRHFEDKRVGAVAGTVVVGNKDRLITQFQAIEYIISQNLDRRALEMAHSIIVVPGAVGAWRRAAITAVGGYDEDTLAEDADLTLKLQRAGWRILAEPNAIAHTEVPQTTRLFLRQRFRWMFGMLQVAWKHAGAFRQKGAAGIKFLALPNIFICQFFFALVAPLVDVLLISSLVVDAIQYFSAHADAVSSRTISLFYYWAAWQALEFAVAALAYLLDGRRIPGSLLPLLIIQRFCYRQLIYYVALTTLAAAIRGRLIGWDKLPRHGMPSAG